VLIALPILASARNSAPPTRQTLGWFVVRRRTALRVAGTFGALCPRGHGTDEIRLARALSDADVQQAFAGRRAADAVTHSTVASKKAAPKRLAVLCRATALPGNGQPVASPGQCRCYIERAEFAAYRREFVKLRPAFALCPSSSNP